MGGSRAMRYLLVLFVLAALGGCGDPPLPGAEALEELSVRTARSEVLNALHQGPREPSDGVLEGHRLDRYFVDGGWAEVLWLEPPEGVEMGADPRTSLNPVIFWYEGLDGWGWDHFDERAAEWGLRVPEASQPEPEPTEEEDPSAQPRGITI